MHTESSNSKALLPLSTAVTVHPKFKRKNRLRIKENYIWNILKSSWIKFPLFVFLKDQNTQYTWAYHKRTNNQIIMKQGIYQSSKKYIYIPRYFDLRRRPVMTLRSTKLSSTAKTCSSSCELPSPVPVLYEAMNYLFSPLSLVIFFSLPVRWDSLIMCMMSMS